MNSICPPSLFIKFLKSLALFVESLVVRLLPVYSLRSKRTRWEEGEGGRRGRDSIDEWRVVLKIGGKGGGGKLLIWHFFPRDRSREKCKVSFSWPKNAAFLFAFPAKKAWKLGRREKFANYCRPNIGEEGKETLGVQPSARIFPALSKRKKLPRFSEGTGEVG